ncbi:hypothetical protein D3C77_521870 [compost metagenome]
MLVGNKRDANQFIASSKPTQISTESRIAALDFKEPGMFCELPAGHRRDHCAIFKLCGFVDRVAVCGILEQHAARKGDIPATDIFR